LDNIPTPKAVTQAFALRKGTNIVNEDCKVKEIYPDRHVHTKTAVQMRTNIECNQLAFLTNSNLEKKMYIEIVIETISF
jgi:hypothetical protein